jgi:hypothetical protein
MVAVIALAGFVLRSRMGEPVGIAWAFVGACLLATIVALTQRCPIASIRIGTDGVLVERGATPEFVAYADLDALRSEIVRRPPQSVYVLSLARANASSIEICVSQGSRQFYAIRDEISHARVRFDSTQGHDRPFDRGDELSDEWRRWIRGIADGREAAPREAAGGSRDDLVSLALDPHVERPMRVAYIEALRPTLRQEERDRFREVAASTAAPEVREALEAAASDVAGSSEAAMRV